MAIFIAGFITGLFTLAFIALPNFRNGVIRQIKKLSKEVQKYANNDGRAKGKATAAGETKTDIRD